MTCGGYYVFTPLSVPLSRVKWTRQQGGRVHYTHASTEASYDRARYLALQLCLCFFLSGVLCYYLRDGNAGY